MEHRDEIIQTFFEFVMKNTAPPEGADDYTRFKHATAFLNKVGDVYDAGYRQGRLDTLKEELITCKPHNSN